MQGGTAAKTCEPSEAAWLVARGWWVAAQELVQAFHQEANQSRQALLETAVRREVGSLRQSANELLLALSPQESERIGVVRCAFQWAQNSSAIFLAIKFAHRWTSPGALKLHGESVEVSDCCFNFSASGEHSQLRKRYGLDLHFFNNVSTEGWSWQLASAGRLTVEMRKKVPAAWPRLVYSQTRPGNMGTWEAMQSKWGPELRDFERARQKQKEAQGEDPPGAPAKPDPEAQEAEEEAKHEALSRRCVNNASSPFFKDRNVAVLCDEYWPPRMKGKQGRDMAWLVLFYTPGGMKCDENDSKCETTGNRWKAIGKKIPEVTSEAKVGAVNCDLHRAFCKKQEIGHMPFVRRYKAGKKKVLYSDWDIDSVMAFIQS